MNIAEARTTWTAWFRSNLEARGWDRKEFLAAANNRAAATGFTCSITGVNQWLSGWSAPLPENAVATADVFGASRIEALRAAGYGRLVELITEELDELRAASEPAIGWPQ